MILVNEKELLRLYKKFQDLDEHSKGVLTNRQLLNLPEFKYTPFRTRLVYALQLKSDTQVKNMRNMQNEDVKLEDLGKLLGQQEDVDPISKKDKDDVDKTDYEAGRDPDEEEGDLNKDEDEKEEDEGLEDGGDQFNRDDDPAFIKLMGTETYINFAEFSKIMSLFNPRTGIDEKI